MAISNKLSISFNYKSIDEKYDFFFISTIEKYIPFGAKCLDNSGNIKTESISFENGKSLYIMTQKGKTTKYDLINQLDNNKLIIKNIISSEIPNYILFRLFLYSLSNFECDELSYNNLTGKFYIIKPEWISKNGKSFTALSINIDSELNIILEACTFAKYSLFKESKKLKEYPKYTFSNKNYSLKRIFDNNSNDITYIKKGIFNKKSEIPFLTLAKQDIHKNKVFYLYYTLKLLKERYNELFSFYFNEINIIKSIGIEKDKFFMNKAMEEFNKNNINFVNYLYGQEYKNDFDLLISSMSKFIKKDYTINSSLSLNTNNILLIHNKEYYEDNKYEDPYSNFNKNYVIQCVTIEDSVGKIISDNTSIINTIIKECVIKNDIINNGYISLDNWKDYNFNGDWIFGREKDGKHYYIIIHNDGSFTFYNKLNDLTSFELDILNKCSDYLTDNKGKEKIIIVDPNNNINVISRTNMFPLPPKEIFDEEIISRSKESRNKYLQGLVDISLYQINNKVFYSSSIKGSGMQSKIIRAPHLYQVDVIEGINIMESILETLSVTFVKYKSFTVLPYPIKYLNEYIEMIK